MNASIYGTQDIARELSLAYSIEMETLLNFIANSAHLEGEQAEAFKTALITYARISLKQARRLAQRLRAVGGNVPGSLEFTRTQGFLQPPPREANPRTILRSTILSGENTINHYRKLAKLCEQRDPATFKLTQEILFEEENQHRAFSTLLKSFAN